MDARTKELEGLLAHSSWVRQLARQLVRDDASADDVVQDVHSFKVEHGRVQFALETPAEFELWGLTLGETVCRPQVLGERGFTDGSSMTLRVVPSAQILLTVVDALTNQQLDHVELWDCTSMPPGRLSIPDKHWNRRTLTDHRSPLLLRGLPGEFQRASWRYLVRSPGYAWTPVQLQMQTSGAHEVRLQRSAQLDVELLSERPRAEAPHVRIYRDAAQDGSFSSLVTEQPIVFQVRFEFEHLPPDTYEVCIEVGAQGSSLHRLAQANLKLVPGAHELVRLETASLEAPTFAALGGTVHVPLDWEVAEIFVYAKLKEPVLCGARSHSVLSQEELVVIRDLPGSYRFHFGALQTGNYTIGVADKASPRLVDRSIEVELGPQGLEALSLEVPGLALVRVTLLDASTGERADVVPTIEEFTVHEGTNDFSLVLQKVCLARLRLLGSDGPLAWEKGSAPEFEGPKPGSYLLGSGREAEARLLRFSEPGRYRLAGWKLPGYEFIEPMELLVERDLVHEYDVVLTPE